MFYIKKKRNSIHLNLINYIFYIYLIYSMREEIEDNSFSRVNEKSILNKGRLGVDLSS